MLKVTTFSCLRVVWSAGELVPLLSPNFQKDICPCINNSGNYFVFMCKTLFSQHNLAKKAVSDLASMYSTYYRYGSIINTICKFEPFNFNKITV